MKCVGSLYRRHGVDGRAGRFARRQTLTRALPLGSLPLFPVQPVGVFLPGMTKTLHLYEDHFKSMIEEAMSDERQLFAMAVLEPNMCDEKIESVSPGSYVGGHNFLLSCGCLCKVLSSKPFPGGYLVRIRGEARLGIAGLEQVEPFMRAQAFPMADAPVRGEDLPLLKDTLEELQDIMRDTQNLASKFRCDETACIQQAMRWVNQDSLLPSVFHLPKSLLTLEPDEIHVSAHEQAGQKCESSMPQEENEEDIVEFASRLSFACLQWLPQSSQEERLAVLRGRLLAMDTLSVLERLNLACKIMGEQRDSLAAKCALKTAER